MRARRVPGVAHGVDLAHPGRCGALGRLAEHALPGDQDPRPAIAEGERHLRRLEQHVQRHGHAAGLEDPEIGDQELRDVGQLQRHRVPRPQAGRLQAGRQPVRQGVQFPVGHLPARIDSRSLAGRRIRGSHRIIARLKFIASPLLLTHAGSFEQGSHRPTAAARCERAAVSRIRCRLISACAPSQPLVQADFLTCQDLRHLAPAPARPPPRGLVAAGPLPPWHQYVPQHVMSSTRRPRTSATPTPARPL